MLENDLVHKMFQFQYNMARISYWDIVDNLAKSEYILMRKIATCHENNHRLTLTQIAHELQLSNPAISRTVKNIEAKQWIVRENDEDDRRNSFVVLTPLGEAELKKASSVIHQVMQEALNKVGEKEMLEFFELGNTIHEAMLETFDDYRQQKQSPNNKE